MINNKISFVEKLIKDYPKKRSFLPKEYNKIYKNFCLYARSDKGYVKKIFKKFTNWMHLKVSDNEKFKILEYGSGNLNHLQFEKYLIYDVVEPTKYLFESSTKKNLINQYYQFLEEIPNDNRYDKIISIATLEHLINLPYDLAKLSLMLNKNGKFKHSIPSEGSFLWFISSRYISGTNFFLRFRLNFDTLLRHEHVNSAKEIEQLISFFFKKVKIKRFPLPFFHLSIFTYLEASSINKDNVNLFLSKYTKNYIKEDFEY